MAASGPQQAKRALVKVLVTLAAFYSVQVTVSRDSGDEELLKAFKRVSLKAHPDKGGLLEHAQALNSAKDTWDQERKTERTGGRGRAKAEPKRGGPADNTQVAAQADGQEQQAAGGLRFQSLGVLLTFNGLLRPGPRSQGYPNLSLGSSTSS